LSGAVQMRNVVPPKLSLQSAMLERFEIYDESVQTTKLNDQRRYEYTLRPRQAGSYELPAIEVSYYDVSVRKYQTVRSLPIPLKVRQATEVTASQVIGGSTNAGPRIRRELELAMRPAGIRMGVAGAEPISLLGNPWRIMMIAGLGPLVFLVGLAGYYIRRTGPSFKRAQRQRQAFAQAQRAIARIPAGSGSGPSADGVETASSQPAGPSVKYASVSAILRNYLADRFDLQAESLTPAEAESLLIQRGFPYDLAKRFSGLMQRHFDASYGSSRVDVDKAGLVAMLAEIENYRSKGSRSKLARVAVWALLVGSYCQEADASTSAERSFIWMESLAGLSSAQSPKDYLAVAGTCQKLVDLGVRNADLFYNQGTALLMADKPAEAVAVLLRAERYGGRSADIARNLAIAEGRKQGGNAPVTSWSRWVLFWHYGLDCATRANLAAMAFSLLWLGAVLRLFGVRRMGIVLMVCAAVLVIFFGSSVLATLQQEGQVVRPAALTSL
jgi:hypothetical protein